MASDCASVIAMMKVEVVCSCPDLASHTSSVGEVQTIYSNINVEANCEESTEGASNVGKYLKIGRVESRCS